MHDVLAIRGRHLGRTFSALRRYEPKILRGLTWSHFGYVALFALAFGVGRALQVSDDPPIPVAWYWIPLHAICGLLILLFAVVLGNLKLQWIPRPVILGLAVAVGCVMALQLHQWLGFSSAHPFGLAIHKLRVLIMQWGLVAAVYYFIERSARRAAALRAAELDRNRIEAQMLQTRLQVMQAQVEPHFLFNTLAHIQRLYQTDPVRGRSMLDSFCGYLRAALPQMRGNRSTVEREIELAQAYLDMQRIRMGRRLRFEFNIPDGLRDAAFPPMMLLSLVENAIKHGLTPLRGGGTVQIVVASGDRTLRVTVVDTGAGLSTAEYSGGDGVGLSNIRSRLATLYRGRGRLTLCANAPHGVVATIEVPLSIESDGATDDQPERVLHASANPRALVTAA